MEIKYISLKVIIDTIKMSPLYDGLKFDSAIIWANRVINKLEIPEAPVVIGLILGPLVESSLRRALILSKGSMMIFIQKPISAIFLLLSLLSMSWPYFAKLYKARMTQKQ